MLIILNTEELLLDYVNFSTSLSSYPITSNPQPTIFSQSTTFKIPCQFLNPLPSFALSLPNPLHNLNHPILIYSFIQSIIKFFIQFFIQSFVQSFIQSFIQSSVQSFIQSLSNPYPILIP